MRHTDPRGRRYPEARAALSWIARRSCSPGDTAAVVHFARSASVTGPLPIRENLKELRAALSPNSSVGDGTYFAPAVTKIGELVAARPEANSVALILTDGDTQDGVEWRQEFGDVDARKFVVALGGRIPDDWSVVELDGVYPLTVDMEHGDVARRLAHAWIALRDVS